MQLAKNMNLINRCKGTIKHLMPSDYCELGYTEIINSITNV